MLVGVSTNGTSILLVQLGDAGGIETTGYTGAGTTVGGAGGGQTIGFGLMGSVSASDVHSGRVVLDLEDSSDFTWTCAAQLTNGTSSMLGTGSKALSAALDRVRITTVNGTDAFDAGVINISYE